MGLQASGHSQFLRHSRFSHGKIVKMIVSASYRTDIPAFYGAWFMNRFAAGSCEAVNPWNRKPYSVSLAQGDVDGFVFWTRHLAPFAEFLPQIAKRAPFYVQYTVTGYPRVLERSVVTTERAVTDLRDLAERFGPRAAVWRYDPVVLTTLTSLEWHLENFTGIARRLEGLVDEATISLVQPYRKTKQNLDRAAAAGGFAWNVEAPEAIRDTTAALAEIAVQHGMSLTVCSQPGLVGGTAHSAACIDAARLTDIAGHSFPSKVKGNRPDCLCHASRDIGAYDTCPHGCAYCYAVSDPASAKQRHAAHDLGGACL